MKHGTERTVECTHECTYPCHRLVLLYHCLKSHHTIQTVWHWLSPLPLSEITAHHSNSLTLTLSSTTVRNHSTPFSLTLTLSSTTVRNHSTPFKQSDIDSLLYHCQKSQHTIQSDSDSLLYHCQKSQHTIQTVWHWLSPLPLSEITANTPFTDSLTLTFSSTTVRNHSTPFKQSDTDSLLYHCQKSQHTIQTVWHWLSPLPLSGITAHHSLIQSDTDSLLYHWQESQHTIQSDIDSLLYHCQKSQRTIQTVWHWLSPLPLSEVTSHHSNSLTFCGYAEAQTAWFKLVPHHTSLGSACAPKPTSFTWLKLHQVHTSNHLIIGTSWKGVRFSDKAYRWLYYERRLCVTRNWLMPGVFTHRQKTIKNQTNKQKTKQTWSKLSHLILTAHQDPAIKSNTSHKLCRGRG